MRRLVPVDLGGSPQPCAVAPSIRQAQDPETVRLLVAVVDERIEGSRGDGPEQGGGGIGDLVAHLVRTEIVAVRRR